MVKMMVVVMETVMERLVPIGAGDDGEDGTGGRARVGFTAS